MRKPTQTGTVTENAQTPPGNREMHWADEMHEDFTIRPNWHGDRTMNPSDVNCKDDFCSRKKGFADVQQAAEPVEIDRLGSLSYVYAASGVCKRSASYPVATH